MLRNKEAADGKQSIRVSGCSRKPEDGQRGNVPNNKKEKTLKNKIMLILSVIIIEESFLFLLFFKFIQGDVCLPESKYVLCFLGVNFYYITAIWEVNWQFHLLLDIN